MLFNLECLSEAVLAIAIMIAAPVETASEAASRPKLQVRDRMGGRLFN